MASTQATIDLVVRGSGAVNRLIEDINQLQTAVNRINSRTLDVASSRLGDRARDLAQATRDIGTRRDPRPDVANRVAQLTQRQTQLTREYERAVSSQSKALEGAARAEQQLAERRQRRTKVDSNTEREIVARLNKNIAAYQAADGQVTQLLGRFRSLSREFAAIQRMSAEARIPLISEQINVNQTAALQRSIRVLAQEFNRLGDSAQFGIDETRLSRTDLPRQTAEFERLSNQLAETRARAQALREELVAIGRNERLLQAPAAPIQVIGPSTSEEELLRNLFQGAASREAASTQGSPAEINRRNRQRQARRAEIRGELRQQNTLIGQLEAEALTAGDAVLELQNRLASLAEFRYRNEPAGRNVSLNQIQAQAESLALVANNSSIASDSFRQFTVAAEMASIKLARSQQATFEALAAGFSTTGGVNIPGGLQQPELMAGARNMVAQLIADIPSLTRSEAALGAHIELLSKIKTLLPFLSLEYRAVEEAIAGLNQELQGVGLRGQASRIDPGAGQRLLKQREREENARQRRITATEKLGDRQVEIEKRINESRFSATEKDQLRLKVEEAFVRLANDELLIAERLTSQVERQVAAKEKLLKSKPAQVFGIEGFSFSPVTGKSKTGAIYPGSPAAQEEIAKQQNKTFKESEAQAEEVLKASQQIEAQQRVLNNLQLEYNAEEGKGVKFLQEKAELAEILNRLAKGEVDFTLANSRAIGENIGKFRELKKTRILQAQATGEYGKRAAPEQLEARRERLLKTAMSGASQLIDLEMKGVSVANERREIEQTISDIQNLRNKASEQELVTLAQKVQAVRNFASTMALDLKAGAIPGAGLRAALQQLQSARQARQEFLGTMSPAEGIDKIVREFTQQGSQALLGLKELANPAKVSTKELEALSAILKEFRSVLDPTIEGFDRLDNQLRETAANLDRQLERRAPDANFLTRRMDPRMANAISEGLIGGAFPLLFGQGLGSSIGGGLGGALGGFAGGGLGFGLSLVGTALGSAVDTFVTNITALAGSLRDPTASLEAMKTAGLNVTPALEFYIKELEASGRAAEAQRVVFAELERQLGPGAAKQLQALNNEQRELQRQWAILSNSLTLSLLPAITGTISIVNDAISGFRSLSSVELPGWLLTAINLSQRAGISMIAGSNPSLALSAKLAGQAISRGKQKADQVQQPTQELTLESQKANLQAQRQVADDIKSAYREGFQLQQRIIDFERKAVDIRRRIEDEIFNKRQEILRQQIDNDRKRAQVAIEAVDLEYQKRIANQEGRAAEILAAEAEVVKTRAEGEANIEASKRQLELDIAKQQRESQNYIFNLSREADSIRRETLSLEMEVADYRESIERKIQDQRLIAAAGEKAAVEQAGGRGAVAAASKVPDLNAGMTGANWPAGVPRPGTPTDGVAFTAAQLQAATSSAAKFNGIANQCSETVKAFYQSLGVSLPGVTAWADTVRKAGKTMTDWSQLKIGDIVATGRPGDTTHVGVYTGGRNVFHQSRSRGLRTGNYPDLGYFQSGGYFVRPGGAITSRTSTAAQFEQAASQARKPRIPSVPFARAASAELALSQQDNKLKEEAIRLDQRLNENRLETARQRLYQAARGPLELKQRKDALIIARAELYAVGALAEEKQAIATFDAQSAAKIQILKEENRLEEIRLKNSKLTKQEQARTIAGMNEAVRIAEQQIALDREALQIAQQRRFVGEKSQLQQRLAVTGAAEQAGFFGAGASAYTAELLNSGNPAQAAELAQLARMQEMKQAVADLRGELNSLTDPFNIAINAAGAIGGAFSESFKGIINGSMSAQQALANFFQRTADHFLDMASQIIAKWITMTILNQTLQLFPSISGGIGGMFGGFGGPSGGFALSGFTMPSYMQAGNAFGFANGSMFDSPITPFAMGGAFSNSIVDSPTLFKFADGGTMQAGLMGESGPEAVMPLTRGPGGRLGVDASGSGGGVNVTVNVDASGSKVQGDDQRAGQLGRAISAAVQQELVKQQRPGGLLAK